MPASLLPVSAIRALRLTCNRCGAAVVIPMSAKDAPAQRFHCGTRRPGPEIVCGLVRALRWLQTYTAAPGADTSVAFDAALEYDPQA